MAHVKGLGKHYVNGCPHNNRHTDVCSVFIHQSAVWVSELVKVKLIGGVSWLLFNRSRNTSCQQYWLTAFTADSSTWHIIDIEWKTSTPVKKPVIIYVMLFSWTTRRPREYWPAEAKGMCLSVCLLCADLPHQPLSAEDRTVRQKLHSTFSNRRESVISLAKC